MKTTKNQIMKHFGLVAIMMAAITLAACSTDDNIISEQHGDRTFTLTVSASKGDDATTRALTLDGTALNATWTVGEAVTVFNVTRNADLTGPLTAQSSGASTTLQGSLTGTIEDGDELKLKFLSPNYASQDGTLATIASTCDYAEATVTVTDASTAAVTTTNATFVNQQAIVKFTLKNKATDAAINVTKLTVTAGGTIINITPASATDVLYVAIPAISSQNVYLSATASGTNYTYVKPSATISNGRFYGFTVSMDPAPSTTSQALTFEAKKAGAVVTFRAGTSVINPIEYSTDGITWTTYTSPITLTNIGDKVSFRGDNATYGTSSSSSNFSCSDDCYIYGNIMSLINSTNYTTTTELTEDYTFENLFTNNDKIYNHPSKQLELPATTLTAYCYSYMFYGCTSLTTAPELPATTLQTYWYQGMSWGCTDLTTAPELPATTLANYCYSFMFNNCTSLINVPDLAATTLADCCCESMFSNCTSLIKAPALPATRMATLCYDFMFGNCTNLTIAPELPATTLASHCYAGMFINCTSLTAAPELPAMTLEPLCYNDMFYNCTSLTTPPVLPATQLAEDCYSYMFSDCTNLTTAPELPATTLAMECYHFMFLNCTSLTTAPELPATTLVEYCYENMFEGCTSLTTAPELSATTLAYRCYKSMFSGCTNLTTAPDLPATTLTEACYNGMFSGCTNLNSIKCLATDISAPDCTTDWLKDVAATGTFTKAASMTSWTTGSSGIPSGWTVNNE